MTWSLDTQIILPLIKKALAEDIGSGDVTSQVLFSASITAEGKIIAKADGIIAGLEVAKLVFEEVDPKIKFNPIFADGIKARKGDKLAELQGPARSILAAERTALNFLGHLSGIATLTAKYVDRVAGGVKIMETRKTAPGLRYLEKYAVAQGGGSNHRFNLEDGILVKDNHLAVARKEGWDIGVVVSKFREKNIKLPIEIEVTDLQELQLAIAACADIVLLDNMELKTLKQAMEMVKKSKQKILTEASGGINLENVSAVAKTGVDRISIGALTHSAPALDVSLEITA